MKKRLIVNIMILVVLGVATFVRMRYNTLLCNVFTAEANWIATLSTFHTVVGFAIGAALVWLAYMLKILNYRKGQLAAIVGLLAIGGVLGTETFYVVRSSTMMLIRIHLDESRIPGVAISATIFAVTAYAIGAATMYLLRRIHR